MKNNLNIFLVIFLSLTSIVAHAGRSITQNKDFKKADVVSPAEADSYKKIANPILALCKKYVYKAHAIDCSKKELELNKEIKKVVIDRKSSFLIHLKGESCPRDSFEYYDCYISIDEMKQSYDKCQNNDDEKACKTFLISDSKVMPTKAGKTLYELRGFSVFLSFCNRRDDPLCELLIEANGNDKIFMNYAHDRRLLREDLEKAERAFED